MFEWKLHIKAINAKYLYIERYWAIEFTLLSVANIYFVLWKMNVVIVWPLKRETQYSVRNRWECRIDTLTHHSHSYMCNRIGFVAIGMHAIFASISMACVQKWEWYQATHNHFIGCCCCCCHRCHCCCYYWCLVFRLERVLIFWYRQYNIWLSFYSICMTVLLSDCYNSKIYTFIHMKFHKIKCWKVIKGERTKMYYHL